MSIGLYDATVATFMQTLGGLDGVLARGLEHCRDQQIELTDIVETRLYPDMLPLRFQVLSTIAHSIGAIEAVRRGVFSPPPSSDYDYAALQRAVAEAREKLAQLSRDEIEGFIGRDTKFDFHGRSIPFTAENFLLSFSTPNFFFHASTAYGILRSKGVPLGKRDFMGMLRIKR